MSNEDVWTIRVPKLSGYKTLMVSAATILFGLANAVWPEFQPPSADTVTLVIDQLSGAIISVIGLVNLLLRLVTTGPAGPKRGRSHALRERQDEEPHAAQARIKQESYLEEVRRRQQTESFLQESGLSAQPAVDKSEQNTDNIDVSTLKHELPDFLVRPKDMEPVRAREDAQ